MNTRTLSKHKKTSKRDKFVKKDERPAFVPRYIGVKFMEIKGVTDVKPSINNEKEIEILVIPNQKGGFNHDLHERILVMEAEIREALRPRRQKFFASISW